MKRLLLRLVIIKFTFCKKVSVCTAYFISATAKLDCGRDFMGQSTMIKMYKKGWTIATNIGDSKKFIIVFKNNLQI